MSHEDLGRIATGTGEDEDSDALVQTPATVALTRQEHRHQNRRDQRRAKETDAEQQVESKSSAQEVRQVGGQSGYFSRNPQTEIHRARKRGATILRQGFARGD